MATTEQLVRLDGQAHEILKRVGNGSLDSGRVRKALQNIIEDRIDPYCSAILTLEDQMRRLRELNELIWHYDGSDQIGQTLECAVSSDSEQRVDDLELLFLDFGSPQANLWEWWKVLERVASPVCVCGLKRTHDVRLARSTHRYSRVGVHRIRIDLTAHWERIRGSSVDDVRESAEASGEILASAEVLAAYALNPGLLKLLDGRHLPYPDLAGYEVLASGVDDGVTPTLQRRRMTRETVLTVCPASEVDTCSAAPVVLEVTS